VEYVAYSLYSFLDYFLIKNIAPNPFNRKSCKCSVLEFGRAIATTSKPSLTNFQTSTEPVNPVAPVTKTRVLGENSNLYFSISVLVFP